MSSIILGADEINRAVALDTEQNVLTADDINRSAAIDTERDYLHRRAFEVVARGVDPASVRGDFSKKFGNDDYDDPYLSAEFAAQLSRYQRAGLIVEAMKRGEQVDYANVIGANTPPNEIPAMQDAVKQMAEFVDPRGDMGMLDRIGMGVERGAAGVGENIRAGLGVNDMDLEDRYRGAKLAQTAEQASPLERPDAAWGERAMVQAAQQAVPMATSLGVQAVGATAGPIGERLAGATFWYTQIQPQRYYEMRDEGLSPETASKLSKISAAVEGAIETAITNPFGAATGEKAIAKEGLKRLLPLEAQTAIKKKLVQLAANYAGELTEEYGQELVYQATAAAGAALDKTGHEDLARRAREVLKAGPDAAGPLLIMQMAGGGAQVTDLSHSDVGEPTQALGNPSLSRPPAADATPGPAAAPAVDIEGQPATVSPAAPAPASTIDAASVVRGQLDFIREAGDNYRPTPEARQALRDALLTPEGAAAWAEEARRTPEGTARLEKLLAAQPVADSDGKPRVARNDMGPGMSRVLTSRADRSAFGELLQQQAQTNQPAPPTQGRSSQAQVAERPPQPAPPFSPEDVLSRFRADVKAAANQDITPRPSAPQSSMEKSLDEEARRQGRPIIWVDPIAGLPFGGWTDTATGATVLQRGYDATTARRYSVHEMLHWAQDNLPPDVVRTLARRIPVESVADAAGEYAERQDAAGIQHQFDLVAEGISVLGEHLSASLATPERMQRVAGVMGRALRPPILRQLRVWVDRALTAIGLSKGDLVKKDAVRKAKAKSWFALRDMIIAAEAASKNAGHQNVETVSESAGQFVVVDPQVSARLSEAAIKKFGLTGVPEEAGYILPDGRMLDFSGRSEASGYKEGKPVDGGKDYLYGQRSIDHRDLDGVEGILELRGHGSGSEMMVDFMTRSGAVRFDARAGLVNSYGIPTDSQIERAGQALRGQDYAVVEVDDAKGTQVAYAEIARPTVAKLRAFYAKIPQGRAAARGVFEKNLANPANQERVRAFVDAVRQEVAEKLAMPPVTPADREIIDRAKKELTADRASIKARILGKGTAGQQLTPDETVQYRELIDSDGMAALDSGKLDALVDAATLVVTYDRTGTAISQAFRLRRDWQEPPAVRGERYIREGILRPPAGVTPAEWAKLIPELMDHLRKQGLDVRTQEARKQVAADPIQTAHAMSLINGAKGGAWDTAKEFYTANLMSGPATQSRNIGSTALNMGMTFLVERQIAGVLNVLQRNADAPQLKEAALFIRGAAPAMAKAGRAFLQTWKTNTPYLELQLGIQDPSELRGSRLANLARRLSKKGPLGKAAGMALNLDRWGLRCSYAADQAMKTLAIHGAVAQHAYRMALQDTPGNVVGRMHDLVDDPSSPAWAEAYVEVTRAAYQDRLPRAIEKIGDAVRSNPIGWFMFVFFKTPVNVALETARRAPLVGLPSAIIKGAKSGDWSHMPTIMARQVIAAAGLWALASMLDDRDRWITGTRRSRAAQSAGNRESMPPPMSIRLPGDGWHSYSWADPMASVVATLIDVIDAYREGGTTEAAIEIPFSLIDQLSSKTFTTMAGDLLRLGSGLRYRAEHTPGLATTSAPPVEQAQPKPFQVSEETVKFVSQWTLGWVPFSSALKTLDRSAGETKQSREAWGTPVSQATRIAQRALQQIDQGLMGDQPVVDQWGRQVPMGRSPIDFGPQSDFLWRTFSPGIAAAPRLALGDRVIFNFYATHPNDAESYPRLPAPQWESRGKTYELTDAEAVQFRTAIGQTAARLVDLARPNADRPTDWDMDLTTTALSIPRKVAQAQYERTGQISPELIAAESENRYLGWVLSVARNSPNEPLPSRSDPGAFSPGWQDQWRERQTARVTRIRSAAATLQGIMQARQVAQ